MRVKGFDYELHPGITMHKIPVKADFAGLVFTLGIIFVCLMGIPAMVYFSVLAIVLGIGVAVMLRFIPRQAGFVVLVLTGVLIVWVAGIPSIDWPEKLDRETLQAAIMAPPPDYVDDSSLFQLLKVPCDSTTQPDRHDQKRGYPQSPFDGTWECTMNHLSGVNLFVADARGGQIGEVVTFHLQMIGPDGMWRVAGKFVAPLLAAHTEGKMLVFEVQHHTYGSPEFGPNVKFRMNLTGDDEALLYNLSEPSMGPSRLVRLE